MECQEKKLNFKSEFTDNISFIGKTLKSKVFVLQNASNLFVTDWIILFDLWEILFVIKLMSSPLPAQIGWQKN